MTSSRISGTEFIVALQHWPIQQMLLGLYATFPTSIYKPLALQLRVLSICLKNQFPGMRAQKKSISPPYILSKAPAAQCITDSLHGISR